MSRGFSKFFEKFSALAYTSLEAKIPCTPFRLFVLMSARLRTLPPLNCDNSITHRAAKINRQNAQSSGKKFVQFAILTFGEKNGIMEVYAKFAAPTFAGGASKKGLPPRGTHKTRGGRRKEVNIRSCWDGVDRLSPSKALGLFVERVGSRVLFVKAEP